jgi:hypothetical protein
MRGAIRDHQRDHQSGNRDYQKPSEAISGHPLRTLGPLTIKGNQGQSRAIKGNQWQSMAIKDNQGQSRAIGPSVYLGASLREGLLHKDRPDPPEGVRPLQPRALIDGVVTAQLRHQASSSVIRRHQASSVVIRVVTAQLRGVRSARRGERMHACLRSFPRDQLRDQ